MEFVKFIIFLIIFLFSCQSKHCVLMQTKQTRFDKTEYFLCFKNEKEYTNWKIFNKIKVIIP